VQNAEIAMIRNTDLPKLLVSEQAALADRGNKALGDLYFGTAAVYVQGVGRVIALKDRIQNPELQADCAGFYQDLTDRYGAGLLDNFDKVRAEIDRVVSRSVAPQQLVRKAGVHTREALVEAIARVLAAVTPQDAAG
jgi:hypothetical protein